MKDIDFTKMVEKVVALKLETIDKLVEEIVEPLADVGNPEKLIGKPYEQWSAQDLQQLTQIYGSSDNSPLSNLVFRKEFEKVKQMEAEEI